MDRWASRSLSAFVGVVSVGVITAAVQPAGYSLGPPEKSWDHRFPSRIVVCAGNHGDWSQWEDNAYVCQMEMLESDVELSAQTIENICQLATPQPRTQPANLEGERGTRTARIPFRSCPQVCEDAQTFLQNDAVLFEWTGYDSYGSWASIYEADDSVMLHWEKIGNTWLWAHEGYHGAYEDYTDETGADQAGATCAGEPA